MDFTVRLKPNGPRRAQTLLKRAYDADPNAQPNRQKIEWRMHSRTGDVRDFTVDPRGNHDCDGLYIWTSRSGATTLRRQLSGDRCMVGPQGSHDCDGLYIFGHLGLEQRLCADR